MEYIDNKEVAYWRVVNRKGEVEAVFPNRFDADNLVIGSGCPYLYEVLPVFRKKREPVALQVHSFD